MNDYDDLTKLTDADLLRVYASRRKQVPPPIHDDRDKRLAVWHEFIRVNDEMHRRFMPDPDSN